MKRKHYIRLILLTLVVCTSLVCLSFARTHSSGQEDTESGKCDGTKPHSEFILWETITRNLLIVRR